MFVLCPCRNNNRDNRPSVARLVEVTKIQAVVLDLNNGMTIEIARPNLELKNQNHPGGEYDRVNSLGAARDRVFKKDVPI